MGLREEIERLRRKGYSAAEIEKALEETPEDWDDSARRFVEQEREDPNGFFSAGGATAGGIFGDAPVAFGGGVSYDPGSIARGAGVMANVSLARLLQEQQEQNRILRELVERSEERERGRLPPAQERKSPFGLLGRKRR